MLALTDAVAASLFPLLALLYVSVFPEGSRAFVTLTLGFTLLSILALVRSLQPIGMIANMLERQVRAQPETRSGACDDDR